MVDEVNPFELLQEQIDTAAAYIDVEEAVLIGWYRRIVCSIRISLSRWMTVH